jgi:hypothetical protein
MHLIYRLAEFGIKIYRFKIWTGKYRKKSALWFNTKIGDSGILYVCNSILEMFKNFGKGSAISIFCLCVATFKINVIV